MSNNKEAKLLIIGSSSYLGRNLAKHYHPEKLILTHNNSPMPNSIFFDMNKHSLDEILKKNPKIERSLILCGIHKYDVINAYPKRAYEVNVQNIKKILLSLKLNNVMPIFTSSDNVFDGKKGKYVETDMVNPTFDYARHKVEIEKYIINNFDNYQIFRISKIIDTNVNGNTLIIDWINKLKSNETILCADDNRFSPIEVNDLCVLIKKLIASELVGLFHLSSNIDLSRKEMLELFLQQVPINIKLSNKIIYKKLKDIKGCENQPASISLNAEKAISATQFKPKTFEEVLNNIMNQNKVFM